ncbi:hypothetical protein jhhlp_004245 [Lomentospora prolificans]|uniref:N-acetyltransferase domain-containing protein n=1 Tax=Lomentospora prolificans TaxID=41688 RepID=A0A2N3NB02_9PEZI|nr:hypothetical protein jhhlp_004245 [Lomentospora prolificans]
MAASADASKAPGLRIELADSADDIERGFHCACETFGRQTADGIWIAMNPGWDTPEGYARGVDNMVSRWRGVAYDKEGNVTTAFVKATLPDPRKDGARIVVGMAIWVQASIVDGYGVPPLEDFSQAMDLNALYPGNPAEQKYLCQLDYSLHKRRIEVVKEKATTDSPAVMVLDFCVVDPAHQRKGIASKLVEWGLDEAKRRGGLEAITEASSMGRHVYIRLGFRQDGPEIDYLVDDQFKDRPRPSNIFMRTGLLK